MAWPHILSQGYFTTKVHSSYTADQFLNLKSLPNHIKCSTKGNVNNAISCEYLLCLQTIRIMNWVSSQAVSWMSLCDQHTCTQSQTRIESLSTGLEIKHSECVHSRSDVQNSILVLNKRKKNQCFSQCKRHLMH